MGDNAHTPPDGVTPKIFKEWRSPRYGTSNPERMNNPLWEWLIESKLGAYQANEALNGPSPFDAGPMWCFDRFGQSTTTFPDGRMVLIAGEHEDHYDPDFYIYNDLVVGREGGEKTIFGFPRHTFPPTDFHSATWTGSQIILIGNLGYPEDRRIGQTQVLVIDPESWSVSRIDSVGQSPGWIHWHNAHMGSDGDSIVVTGGKVVWDESRDTAENIDEWKLQLDGWRWERLSERRWARFEVYREDKKRNHLFEMWLEFTMKGSGLYDLLSRASQLESDLGGPLQLDLVASLFSPPVPHETLPQNEDEHRVHRISVDGIVVKYVEESRSVQATVEGELPPQVVELLRQDLTRKLEAIEYAPMVCVDIPR